MQVIKRIRCAALSDDERDCCSNCDRCEAECEGSLVGDRREVDCQDQGPNQCIPSKTIRPCRALSTTHPVSAIGI
jgi:hypothetical protein